MADGTNQNNTITLTSNRIRIVQGSFFRTSNIYYYMTGILSCVAIFSATYGFSEGYFLSYLLLFRLLFSSLDKHHVTRILRRGDLWPEAKLIARLKMHIHLQWVYLIWAILSILALTFQIDSSGKYDDTNSISRVLILFDLIGSFFQMATLIALHINPYWGLVIINSTQIYQGGGASSEEINSIPIYKYKNNSTIMVGEKSVQMGNEISPSCPICLSEYRDGEDIRIMGCDHYVHKNCINEWYVQQFNCVICRYDLRTGQYPDNSDISNENIV